MINLYLMRVLHHLSWDYGHTTPLSQGELAHIAHCEREGHTPLRVASVLHCTRSWRMDIVPTVGDDD